MESSSWIRRLKDNRPKEVLTATLYFCFLCYGIGFSILPPTMIDIAEILETKLENVAFGVVGRAASYAMFALVFGWLFTKMDRLHGMVLCLASSGLIGTAVPYSSSLMIFILTQVLLGITTSGVDVAGNAWLLEMWQEKANPYMQGMHFAYALGLTIAPLMSEPFLSKSLKNETTVNNTSLFDTQFILDRNNNEFSATQETVGEEEQHSNGTLQTESRIWIPYTISGFLLILASALLLAISFVIPYMQQKREASNSSQNSSQHQQATQDDMESSIVTTSEAVTRGGYFDYMLLVLLGNFLMCFYTGVELNAFSFLPDFVVYSSMKLSKSTGAFMTSVMAGAFAVFRGMSILTATKTTSEIMLQTHFCILCIGNVLLTVSGLISSVTLTWVSIVIMGVGMSCMFPTIYAYLEERIVVTNFLTGIFIFSSAICTVVYPIIVGLTIKKYPMIFAYVNISSLLVCVAVFTGLFIIERRHRSNECHDNNSMKSC